MSRRLHPDELALFQRMGKMYLAGATVLWLSEHFDKDEDRIKCFFKRYGIKRGRLHKQGQGRAKPKEVETLMRQAGFL